MGNGGLQLFSQALHFWQWRRRRWRRRTSVLSPIPGRDCAIRRSKITLHSFNPLRHAQLVQIWDTDRFLKLYRGGVISLGQSFCVFSFEICIPSSSPPLPPLSANLKNKTCTVLNPFPNKQLHPCILRLWSSMFERWWKLTSAYSTFHTHFKIKRGGHHYLQFRSGVKSRFCLELKTSAYYSIWKHTRRPRPVMTDDDLTSVYARTRAQFALLPYQLSGDIDHEIAKARDAMESRWPNIWTRVGQDWKNNIHHTWAFDLKVDAQAM